MAKTEVILTHNIVGLGGESDQVKVAAGYARNYLLPQGLAIPLTATNKRRLESLKQRRAEREAHELDTMAELGKSISKLLCLITVKTGEDGKMFGTVTSGMIADQLKTQFDISLDKKKIYLETPIRVLGEHEIELRLHPDVTSSLKVRVESSTPLPEVPAAPAAEPRKDGREGRPDRDRRGKPGEVAADKTGKADTGAKKFAPRGDRPARTDRPAKTDREKKPQA